MAEAQDRVSPREYVEYGQLWGMDPWGEYRADLRNAMLCMMVASIFSAKGKRPKLEDFMLRFDRPAKSADQIVGTLKHITEALQAAASGNDKNA